MIEAEANPILAMGRDIKLSHTVFALPFALLATFMAAGGWCGWEAMGLILLCMVTARTFAMLANRYLDRAIDANNPRTATRALPSGRVTAAQVRWALAASAALFVLSAAGFWWALDNPWPLAASPLVLIWIGAYGYFKRFTALCHFFLGTALALSPLAAALAIDPDSLRSTSFWWLAAFVGLWVGGFDIIYALQDLEVDRAEGLHSIPAKLGKTRSLLVAKAAHLLAVAALVLCRLSFPLFSDLFGVAVVAVAATLAAEHMAASRGRFSMAFFTFNGLISLGLGGVGIADILM